MSRNAPRGDRVSLGLMMGALACVIASLALRVSDHPGAEAYRLPIAAAAVLCLVLFVVRNTIMRSR